MILYPTSELQNGRCVSLRRGRIDEAEIWHVDPLEMAQKFAAAGANIMQITDFDALASDGRNEALIQRILREVPISVQLAGGIRTRERAEFWLEQGVAKVVIGTAATINPDMVLETARFHPDAVVLAVDVQDGRVKAQGWRETTAFAPEDFIAYFKSAPLAGITITDIASDIGDGDGSLGVISALAAACRHQVIASGIVRSLDDISRLKYVGNVHGALVGRALFNRAVDLAEALAVAAAPIEPTAAFI